MVANKMLLSTGTKRALPPKVAKMKARKKQKLENPRQVAEASQSKGNAQRAEKAISLDELPWREVELPDQMDDYEGFFGLEEIEGVDVIRDEDSGKVSYQIVDGKKTPGKSDKGEYAAETNGAKSSIADAGEDEDEWGGIEDEDVPTTVSKSDSVHAQADKSLDKQKTGKKNNKKEKITKISKSKDGDDTRLNKTGFTLLEDQDHNEDADVSAWNSLGLSQETLSSLSKIGFSRPSEIQSSAIPLICAGHDVIGKAPTGSGKTLAFGIPIVEEWLQRLRALMGRKNTTWMIPSALIISPTRELAHQITSHIQSLISNADLSEKIRIATLTGGLSIQKQRRLLAKAQFVVGTPGRLWEVISEGQGVLESLKRIKFLVVDEADRLLSEGNFKELEQILTALDKQITDEDGNAKPRHPHEPTQRQTLVFSATFSKSLQQSLSRRSSLPGYSSQHDTMAYLLRKLNFRSGDARPHFVDVNPVAPMAANLREGIVECPASTDKDLYLYTLILYHHPGARALIFVNSIDAVRRLVPLLTNLNVTAYPLHSHMAQKARLRSVERFASSSTAGAETKLLVATDVAARGLDIPNTTLIVHYNVPRTADAYVHRSGRTARAAASGSSILLCAPDEAAGVRRLVAQLHRRTDRGKGKGKGKSTGELQALYPDARLVAALKPRVALAKRIADAGLVDARKAREDAFFAAARADLGVSGSEDDEGPQGDDEEDEDGLDFDERGEDVPRRVKATAKGKRKTGDEEPVRAERGATKARGRGKERLTKAEMGGLRAELKGMLGRKLNIGVSERYLVGRGGELVERLLKERDGAAATAGEDGARGQFKGKPQSGSVGFAGGMVLGTVQGLGWEL